MGRVKNSNKSTPSTSKMTKSKTEISGSKKVEKEKTATVVRPYVLDVVKALANEIKLARNMEKEKEKENESKKEIVEIDLSDSDSVVEITPMTSKNSGESRGRMNEANESFITIDETSFFQDQKVINLADETPPTVKRNKKKPKTLSITINDTPKGTMNKSPKKSTRRTVTLKDTLLNLKPATKDCLAHLKNKTNVPGVCPLSPLVKVRSQGRYFEDKSPASKAAGRITKKQRRKLQANKNTPIGKRKRKRRLPQHQAGDGVAMCIDVESESFWGPGVKNPNPQFENNVQNLQLREIVVDGQNVARGHANCGFSPKGISLVVNYFKARGHKVVVFLPNNCMGLDKNNILKQMEKDGTLVYTPSRKVDGKLLQPYDDRFIIEYATDVAGVVVSRDQFRDLMDENPGFRNTIVNRLLMYTFVGDMLMFPSDPLGQTGPSLDQMLHFEPGEKSPQAIRKETEKFGLAPPCGNAQPPNIQQPQCVQPSNVQYFPPQRFNVPPSVNLQKDFVNVPNFPPPNIQQGFLPLNANLQQRFPPISSNVQQGFVPQNIQQGYPPPSSNIQPGYPPLSNNLQQGFPPSGSNVQQGVAPPNVQQSFAPSSSNTQQVYTSTQHGFALSNNNTKQKFSTHCVTTDSSLPHTVTSTSDLEVID